MRIRAPALTLAKDPGSILLIAFMAISTAALRLSRMMANAIVLWHVYGQGRASQEHLLITRFKPELVVSNGDVLYGMSSQHYLIGAAIWLMTSIAFFALFYRYGVPQRFRRLFEHQQPVKVGSAKVLVWALALFFLVPGWLSLGPALTLAFLSLLIVVRWAWRSADGK